VTEPIIESKSNVFADLGFDSGEAAIDFAAENFGPLMMLRGMLEGQGTWTDVREELARIYDRRQPGEYLVVVGRKL